MKGMVYRSQQTSTWLKREQGKKDHLLSGREPFVAGNKVIFFSDKALRPIASDDRMRSAV
jgi:hypothetical protein